MTGSPLVQGDQVIVEVGSSEGTVMAFSIRDGKHLWSSEANEPAGHSGGPVPIVVEGVPCVAVLALRHLWVLRTEGDSAGQTVASFEWETSFANNIPTPAVHGQSILITTKYNHETICRIDVTLDGAERAWEQQVASGVCSPVIHRDRVYWSSHEMFCLDWDTGDVRWRGGRFGDAGSCIATSDDRMIVWAGRGKLALVDIDPDQREYRELEQHELGAPSDAWPHVVLADGHLLVKTREGLVRCISVLGSGSR